MVARISLVTFALLLLSTLVLFCVHRTKILAPTPLQELAYWLKEATPQDALLIVGPNRELAGLRLLAQRALLFDYRNLPMKPKDTVLWYELGREISGLPPQTDWHELGSGYHSLNTSRARKLAEKYGATHILVSTYEHRGDLSSLDLQYQKNGYAVYNLGRP